MLSITPIGRVSISAFLRQSVDCPLTSIHSSAIMYRSCICLHTEDKRTHDKRKRPHSQRNSCRMHYWSSVVGGHLWMINHFEKSVWSLPFFRKKMNREGLVKMEWKKAESWDNTTMQNRDQWYMLIFIMCKLFCSFTRGILLSIWW